MDLDIELIKEALKYSIIVKNDKEEFIDVPGVVTLAYHPRLQRYVLVFGSTAQNAGFVLLEDFGKLWKVKKVNG